MTAKLTSVLVTNPKVLAQILGGCRPETTATTKTAFPTTSSDVTPLLRMGFEEVVIAVFGFGVGTMAILAAILQTGDLFDADAPLGQRRDGRRQWRGKEVDVV